MLSMKTPYIPSKISRLFSVRLWALLILAPLVFIACPSPTSSGPESYSYTVTFDKNGGDTEANPQTRTVASPATTVDSLPADPTRSGYIFIGWNTAPGGTGTPFTASTPVTGNITVYAQ
jgi:uncharacterized repeat protein (TIGR02543 family)